MENATCETGLYSDTLTPNHFQFQRIARLNEALLRAGSAHGRKSIEVNVVQEFSKSVIEKGLISFAAPEIWEHRGSEHRESDGPLGKPQEMAGLWGGHDK